MYLATSMNLCSVGIENRIVGCVSAIFKSSFYGPTSVLFYLLAHNLRHIIVFYKPFKMVKKGYTILIGIHSRLNLDLSVRIKHLTHWLLVWELKISKFGIWFLDTTQISFMLLLVMKKEEKRRKTYISFGGVVVIVNSRTFTKMLRLCF